MDTTIPWRPPRFWRLLQVVARGVVAALARLRVTGDVPAELRGGPLLLAGNHIGNFDPIVLVAATRVRRIAPRLMATGGLFRAPVVGAGDAGVRAHPGQPPLADVAPTRCTRRRRRSPQRLGGAAVPGGPDRAGPGHVAGARQDRRGAAGAGQPARRWCRSRSGASHEVLAVPRRRGDAAPRCCGRCCAGRWYGCTSAPPVDLSDLTAERARRGAAGHRTDHRRRSPTTLAPLRVDEPRPAPLRRPDPAADAPHRRTARATGRTARRP